MATIEENFQSPHQQSPHHAPSLFVEYAHGSMSDKALEALHGWYLTKMIVGCGLGMLHLSELRTSYGYPAPRFLEDQFELLQLIHKDLRSFKPNCNLWTDRGV